MKPIPFSLLAAACAAGLFFPGEVSAVDIHWLGDESPAAPVGVSWGVPWPRGVLPRDATLALRTGDGRAIPMQTWATGYWPDGSLKWTGHAILSGEGMDGPLVIEPGAPAAPETPVQVTESPDSFEITTGTMRVRMARSGSEIIPEIAIGDTTIARRGRLELLLQDRSRHADEGVLRDVRYVGRVDRATLEQSGPVRAVVKLEGTHQAVGGERTLLPFVVRLYCFAGSDQIKVVHSFVFDGDVQQDFLHGLGVAFDVPLREEIHNRHVRFGGESGMWAEPVQPMVGRREMYYPGSEDRKLFPDQLAGRRVPDLGQFSGNQRRFFDEAAQWGDFRQTQLTPDGYTIEKRVAGHGSWLRAFGGRRSLGLAFVGDVSGGLAVAMKDYWRKAPSSFDVRGALGDTATLTAWLWSPEAQPCDLRHYDNRGHGLDFAYEDWKPGWDDAYGLAVTSELSLWARAGVPPNDELVALARATGEPPLLVATPEYYHALHAFGYWSLPDRSHPVPARFEDQQDAALAFFRDEPEQRSWYGFLDYGDMMRMYNQMRHEWLYDVGGWAWNNTELMPDLWWWYSFLRSGREDVFRLAAAMTRHTSEVDVHHLGRFAPLGSRHNVNHLGDGAKQPRISNAMLKRIFYYLTTDERTGDLMTEQLDAARAYDETKRNDTRNPQTGEYVSMSFGTDWAAYVINYLTAYERTLDRRWLDLIVAGLDSQVELAAVPGQLLGSGLYDYRTGRFMPRPAAAARGGRGGRGGEGGGPSSFDLLFGTSEMMFETEMMVDHPRFWAAWTEYCANSGNARLLAYAAMKRSDAALGARAIQSLGRGEVFPTTLRLLEGPDYPRALHEAPMSRDNAPEAGDCNRLLTLIEVLGMAKDFLPAAGAAEGPAE